MTTGDPRWFAGLERRADPGRPLMVAVPPYTRGPEVFAGWIDQLSNADFVVAQLPGRGSRLFEKPEDDSGALAGRLAAELAELVPDQWVLAGHCSGSYLALETAARLMPVGRAPAHLVLSSSRTPAGLADPDSAQSRAAAAILSATDDELAQRLRERGSLPAEFTEPEFIAAILAAHRSAVRAAAGYRCTWPRLAVASDVWRGEADTTLDRSRAQEWDQYLAGPVRQISFPGCREYIERPMPAAVELVEELISHGQ
ncbi:thioesterase II family protein [Amycolatopsis saalfeldensis]|uniref:Surfactin synthase thioesterase subunit n=1 Tax=Amycolatopsis saalfeldensis TaxID=394193 RepID=A0A1H8Y8S5_9PSEU|nr:thioesterase domain-containing protein [Amycolatopsis saalfeldensis]SEP48391.1 Surfactin synthase thioesterase subunit [Amycolatopsis saalfeldensis]